MTLSHDDRCPMARLGTIAERKEHHAELMLNGNLNEEGIIIANDLKADAFAIRWAIREIEGLQAEVRAFKAAEVG